MLAYFLPFTPPDDLGTGSDALKGKGRKVNLCTNDQIFLDKFSLTRSLAQKPVMSAFEKGDL